VQRVKTDLERIMGLRADPVLTRIYRWPRANPQYDVGHPDRMARLRSLCAEHPGLFVIGSAFDGVGVPDCVRQGKQTASSIIGYLSTAKPLGQGLLDEQGAYAY
jgi:oxygen-dependent protoporphyrinogen oxidase